MSTIYMGNRFVDHYKGPKLPAPKHTKTGIDFTRTGVFVFRLTEDDGATWTIQPVLGYETTEGNAWRKAANETANLVGELSRIEPLEILPA